ncbi:hypothetical protein [Peredibacter starrii]|uniref:Uncharacterized protein n=1 Tax=Peredibacter starrii TaxID=28202 RepID=A0AAX4HJZ7_9BACT|nr:hypothetical protein [Peredibacter starrii]WPU63553.1 hypothetical protein SOO65_12725 [Peredibacter starrii]
MKAYLKATLGSIMISVLATGCNQDSSNSNSVSTNFAVTGSGQNAVAQGQFQKAFSFIMPSAIALTPPLLVDSNGTQVDLNEAWIALKHIQFKTSVSDDSNGNSVAHYNGPFYINLLSDQPVSFGEIILPQEGLRRVKMLLHKGNSIPADAPAGLSGKSIYFNAMVNSQNLIFEADETTDFSISGSNAVVPERDKDLLTVIRMADLFKKIDLSGINSNTTISSSSRFPAVNPCPEIHPSASDLYTCFRMGISQEARFGKDDGDKDLDANDEVVNE